MWCFFPHTPAFAHQQHAARTGVKLAVLPLLMRLLSRLLMRSGTATRNETLTCMFICRIFSCGGVYVTRRTNQVPDHAEHARKDCDF